MAAQFFPGMYGGNELSPTFKALSGGISGGMQGVSELQKLQLLQQQANDTHAAAQQNLLATALGNRSAQYKQDEYEANRGNRDSATANALAGQQNDLTSQGQKIAANAQALQLGHINLQDAAEELIDNGDKRDVARRFRLPAAQQQINQTAAAIAEKQAQTKHVAALTEAIGWARDPNNPEVMRQQVDLLRGLLSTFDPNGLAATNPKFAADLKSTGDMMGFHGPHMDTAIKLHGMAMQAQREAAQQDRMEQIYGRNEGRQPRTPQGAYIQGIRDGLDSNDPEQAMAAATGLAQSKDPMGLKSPDDIRLEAQMTLRGQGAQYWPGANGKPSQLLDLGGQPYQSRRRGQGVTQMPSSSAAGTQPPLQPAVASSPDRAAYTADQLRQMPIGKEIVGADGRTYAKTATGWFPAASQQTPATQP